MAPLRWGTIGVLALVAASCGSVPTPEAADDALLALRRHERWAWALGIVLIWADVVLPIPQTAVIAALGIVYGTVPGAVLGSIGMISGGLLGYALMLTSARRHLRRLVGTRSLQTLERVFDQRGAWAIVLTRSLPYSVPEAMVFLAGLAGMPIGQFVAALTIGSVPTAFVFAAIGDGWAHQPILALAVSYVLPILALPVALYLMAPSRQREGGWAPLVANVSASCLYVAALLACSAGVTGTAGVLLALSGALLALAGAAVVVRSRAELGSAWSFMPRANHDAGFVTAGPYRVVRHPVYFGFILFAVGVALAFGSWPAVTIALCGVAPTFAWRARTEEKLLVRTFGDRYAAYRQRTRMIIPYVF
jgi:protein-S-isoprenylcysteine O-methyltransferase Ste14